MRLADKLKHLRLVEGLIRGKDRALTQAEVVRLMREELGRTISQAYLSQLESGAREHMTMTTRTLLSQFFKVHPGYLVSDPDEYEEELRTGPLLAVGRPRAGPAMVGEAPAAPERGRDRRDAALREWLRAAGRRPELGAEVQATLLKLADLPDPTIYIRLLRLLIELPEVARDLLEVLEK